MRPLTTGSPVCSPKAPTYNWILHPTRTASWSSTGSQIGICRYESLAITNQCSCKGKVWLTLELLKYQPFMGEIIKKRKKNSSMFFLLLPGLWCWPSVITCTAGHGQIEYVFLEVKMLDSSWNCFWHQEALQFFSCAPVWEGFDVLVFALGHHLHSERHGQIKDVFLEKLSLCSAFKTLF